MAEVIQGDTPIYDELMAKRMPAAAERIVNLPAPVTSSLGSEALQETIVTVDPQVEQQSREKKLLSIEGYSPGAQAVIKTINGAILDRTYTIMGRSFVDYVKDHQPYITSHEFKKLEHEVRAL